MRSRPEPPPLRKYLNPADLKRLHNLQFAAKLIVEGYYQGKHRSPYHDFSSEFADYRPYAPGDDIRSVDWRAFARTDRYYIKLYRKETDMSCCIVVDKSNSMAFKGQEDLTKLEYASYLAAGLAYLMVKQGDKVGMAVCDDRVRTFVPPGGTNLTLQRILVQLMAAKPGGPTKLSDALQVLFGMVKRKGLLIVISDFLDDTEKVFSSLGMFAHKGFSVLLFQVLTDDEVNLPPVSNALFKDPESELRIATEPDSIRKAYQQEMEMFIESLSANAKARRMHYQLATTAQPYHEALEAYLTARAKV